MKKYLLVSLLAITLFSCQKQVEEALASSGGSNSTLYVATGVCNSGQGITTYTSATATRTIERYSLSSGANLSPLFDFSNVSSGLPTLAYPADIKNSGSNLYVLSEAGTISRSIILVPKSSPYTYTTSVANNATAFNGTLSSFNIDDEGSFLINKTTGIEKFNSLATRLTASGAAWVNAPGGACATATTRMTSVITLPASGGVKGHVIFAHQGATSGTNRIGIVYGSTGYQQTANCLSGAQINSTTHTRASNLSAGTISFVSTGTSPTSMVFVPYASGTVIGKLIVSYSNAQLSNAVSGTATTLNHGIVAWDVTQATAATAALSNPVVLFDDHNVVYAASAMAYDSATSSLYVAVGGNPGSNNQASLGSGYNIEKFTLDMSDAVNTGPTLTRTSPTFITGGTNTKCISGLAIGE